MQNPGETAFYTQRRSQRHRHFTLTTLFCTELSTGLFPAAAIKGRAFASTGGVSERV